jgi:hypothetical protein
MVRTRPAFRTSKSFSALLLSSRPANSYLLTYTVLPIALLVATSRGRFPPHAICSSTDAIDYYSSKLGSQPPASMSATSSQYYRSANTHSHYPGFPANNQEHVYALAAPWHQDAPHSSYTGPPSAAFLHYPQGGAGSVTHASSPPQAWSTTYARQELQAWGQSAGDHTYAPRPSVSYDAVEGSAPMPHGASQASRQYQHQQTLNTRTDLPLSPMSDGYHRNTDKFHEPRIAPVRALPTLCRTLLCD